MIAGLMQCVVDVAVLEALGRNAHWNIEGPTFSQLHELFGDIYEEAGEALDDLAERVRQLGGYVTVDLTAFQNAAGIALPVAPKTAQEWLAAVLAGLDKTIFDLRALERITQDVPAVEVQDLALSIAQKLLKKRWMVLSTMH